MKNAIILQQEDVHQKIPLMFKLAKCSIIIRCYNEEQHIGRLLEGITQQTVKDVEIIVVDSGSTDATVSIASHYPVKILSIKSEEFSFGRALNIGCQAATGDLIVIASAHVYPLYRDWLENLLKPFSNPEIALVYGKQRGNEITKYSEHQVFAKWFPERSNCEQSHPFSNNANAAIRRSLWQKLPYDESLTGLEDLDWAKRVQNMGHKVAYSAEAVVVHVHDESPSRIYNRYRREAIALKQICPEESFYFWDFLRLFVANLIIGEIHYTSVFKRFRAWNKNGIITNWFEESVCRLQRHDLLDTGTIHGDGTSTAVKKGGDNIGFNGHKRHKGKKIVAFTDRNANIIAPFVSAPGNRNETILLEGSPNKRGRKRIYDEEIFQERFRTVERAFAWEDKFKRFLLRFERKSSHHFGLKMLAYTLINLRHFC